MGGKLVEVSKRTDYALRMLAVLAKNPDSVISVRKIAEQEHMPYSFIRTIQRQLASLGLVKNERGTTGGMQLTADLRKVTLLEVLEAVQGPLTIAACQPPENTGGELLCDQVSCDQFDHCAYGGVFVHAEDMLRSYFASITLADILPSASSSDAISLDQLEALETTKVPNVKNHSL